MIGRGVFLCLVCVSLLACTSSPAPRAAGNTKQLSGKVLERLDAPPYSFLRLDLGQAKTWVAVPIGTASDGDRVKLVNGVTLRNYDVKAIGKRFDEIVFATVSDR